NLNRRSTRACRHNFNLVIYPSQHSGKAAVSPSNALYIRNIPITVPRAQVEEFLSAFGTLTYCAMREDHYGNPVWVVYAEYDCLECSKNALLRLHGSSEHFTGPPVMVKYADNDEAKQERRRRREEGKVSRAPPPRSVCVFPPTRHVATPELHQSNYVDAPATVSNTSSLSAAACPCDFTRSRDSAACSVGPAQCSDTSSTASSVRKVADNVFTSPAPPLMDTALPPPVFAATHQSRQPPKYPGEPPCEVVPARPSMMRRSSCNNDGQPVLIMLENGQQLLLASNAVNVRPSDFAPPSTPAFLWPSLDMMYTSPPPMPQPFTVVQFP
ncbi:RNA-binding protein, partial [Trypanosoma conorhini]